MSLAVSVPDGIIPEPIEPETWVINENCDITSLLDYPLSVGINFTSNGVKFTNFKIEKEIR